MIRTVICAESLPQGRGLAAALEEDERIAVAGVITTSQFASAEVWADVLVVAGRPFDKMLRAGCPIVLLSDERFDGHLPGQVRAWLPLDVPNSEFAAAVMAAANDLVVLTDSQAKRWLKSSASSAGPTPQEELTPRELQVLRMLADGSGNKEIAAELEISTHTAKFHVAQILAKLGASSRTEAVATGIRRGLIAI